MYQAIVTRYHGPTNTRGSRVSAKASAGRVSISYDSAKSQDQNHAAAAQALCRKFKWLPSQGRAFSGIWVGGGLPDNSGNAYVLTGEGYTPDGWPPGSAFEMEG